MSNYPSLFALNSSICEQFHSYIRRFKSAATNMKMANFMRWLRLWVNVWNSDKVEQILAASAPLDCDDRDHDDEDDKGDDDD
jgi:hypothetical protein